MTTETAPYNYRALAVGLQRQLSGPEVQVWAACILGRVSSDPVPAVLRGRAGCGPRVRCEASLQALKSWRLGEQGCFQSALEGWRRDQSRGFWGFVYKRRVFQRTARKADGVKENKAAWQ